MQPRTKSRDVLPCSRRARARLRRARRTHARDRGASARVYLRWLAALFALFALLSGRRASAEIPAEWAGSKVVAVHVVGEAAGRVDERALGVPLGAPLNRALVRGAIERLAASGRWSDVQVDGVREADGIALLFHLVPRLLVRRVDVVGNHVFDDREIVRILGLREESELDQESLPSALRALREAYAERGRYDAVVNAQLRDTDDPALKVVRIAIREGKPTTIAAVRFTGEALPRRRGVRRLLGVGVGQPADLTRIREGLAKTEQLLRRSGYYAAELGAPALERHGHKATVVVAAYVGPRFELRFSGNGPISRSELFATLALDQERYVGAASLRGLEHKLVEHYQRYGFPDVKVQARATLEVHKLRSENPDEPWEEEVMAVGIEIEPGEQLEIETITFPGASHYSQDFLREQVFSYLEQELPGSALREPVDSDLADRLGFGGSKRPREREVPKPPLLDPRRLFHGPTYARAIEHIRELYRGDGFLESEVQDVTLTPLREPNHAVAVIAVVEGPRTFLHEVRIENNRHLSSRALLSAAGLARDAPFSYLKLEEARLRMIEACQEEGYFFAEIEPSLRKSQDGTRAEVTFRVEEGYQVRVGAIEIRGAERSRRTMIEDRAQFAVGDLYRPSAARKTQDALLALDVFSSVVVAPDEPDLPARVKTVVITVTERKTQWLGWSAGFSTGEGVRGGLEYGYRNLFGSAMQAGFRGQLGYQFVFLDKEAQARYQSLPANQRAEYQATLSLGVPYLPHLPKLRLNLDISALADIQRDFRMQKQSGVTSLIYRPERRWTFTASEELEFSDFFLFGEKDLSSFGNVGNLTVADLVPTGQNTLFSSQLAAAWDHRDRSFNPHRGFLVSATSEWARTLHDNRKQVTLGDMAQTVVFKSNMLRFTASFAFYIPLGPKVTFASQTRYGRVVHLVPGSEAYPNRRFYLGGPNFRGYYYNEMVPQDLKEKSAATAGLVSRGADTFLATQNELRFPIAGQLYGGIFSDIGNLWANAKNLTWRELRNLQPVVGLGLRFQLPVAALAFDYGVRAIHTNPFRPVGAFQFSFQTF